jgi:hypothetical protein
LEALLELSSLKRLSEVREKDDGLRVPLVLEVKGSSNSFKRIMGT